MTGARDCCGRSLAFLGPVPTVFILFPVFLSLNNFFVPSAKEAHLKGRERRSLVRMPENQPSVPRRPGGGEQACPDHSTGQGRLGKPLRIDAFRKNIIAEPLFKMHRLPAGYLRIIPCKMLLVKCFRNRVPGNTGY